VSHRSVRLARRRHRAGVEAVVLGLDRPALARVPRAGEALGDEPAHARLACGGQQCVGALDPQPVGLRERAVEVPGEAHIRQSGRLMDDRVGPAFEHGLADGARVE
jgi:hypothetical protein